MWIAVQQLDQLKYGSLSKRKANEGGGKDSKSQRLISSMFMMKSEILKKSLIELEQIMDDPSQMFKVFNLLVILQEQYDEMKNKPEGLQERIHNLRINNIDLIIGTSLEVSSDYNDTFKYLESVDEYMKVYIEENNDKFSIHFTLRKSVFDEIFQKVKEIYYIIIDPSLLEEEETPKTPQASSSGYPTTPGSGHSRGSPLSWSIYKKNKPSKRASPQNKWSPLNPNKTTNTIVKTPEEFDPFDLRYFKVLLYNLEEGESLNKKKYWRSVLADKGEREHYFPPVHPHQILQTNTLQIWDWSLFSVHQIATIQHFSFLLSKLYETPEKYQDNLVRFLARFNGEKQIDEACYFCQYCENQEPRPLENEDKVIKYIFEDEDMNNDEKNSARFRSFLPDRPLEWLLVDDTYNENYVKRYHNAVNTDYDLVYNIFHKTNFGEYMYSNSVKEFVKIYEFYYEIETDSNRELLLNTLKEILNYVDDERPVSIQKMIEDKTTHYLETEPENDWQLFRNLSNCFI